MAEELSEKAARPPASPNRLPKASGAEASDANSVDDDGMFENDLPSFAEPLIKKLRDGDSTNSERRHGDAGSSVHFQIDDELNPTKAESEGLFSGLAKTQIERTMPATNFLSDVLFETRLSKVDTVPTMKSNDRRQPNPAFRPRSLLRKKARVRASCADDSPACNSSSKVTVKATCLDRSTDQTTQLRQVSVLQNGSRSADVFNVELCRDEKKSIQEIRTSANIGTDDPWDVDCEYDPYEPNNYEIILEMCEQERLKAIEREIMDRKRIRQEEKRRKLEDERREEALRQSQILPRAHGMGRGRSLVLPAWALRQQAKRATSAPSTSSGAPQNNENQGD